MAADIALVQPETLRHKVEHALRQAIMSGSLAPGDRLVERELCESMGVSRTSVREAIRALEAEKLVTSIPHRGPTVSIISRAEAMELYALRGLLEGHAAAEFARIASPVAVNLFGVKAKALRARAVAADQMGVLQAKSELYDVLLDNCGNGLIKDILKGLHSRVNMLRATSLMHPDRLMPSLREIDKLYAALKARDPVAAEAAAKHHVANACKIALVMLDERNAALAEALSA